MTVVAEYQEQTEELAASTVASVLALYAAVQAGGIAPAVAVPAIAAVVATANATAVTLADLAVSAQIEAATGVPTPPTGITPRDDTERLIKALETILADLPQPGATPDYSELLDVAPEPDDAEPDDDEPEPDPDDEPDAEPEPAPERDDQPEAEPEPDDEPDEPDEDQRAADAERMLRRLERMARSEPLDTGQAVTAVVIERQPSVIGWRRALDADPCERCQRWAEDGRVFSTRHHFKRHYGCNCQMEIVTRETEGTTP